MHAKDKLAAELHKANLPDMAIKAAHGYYHDYLSPLATPCLQLAADLQAAGTPEALALRARHLNGEFDTSKDESDARAASEDGKAAFAGLVGGAQEKYTSKPRRALKPDAQAFDRIEITTVPRYKESELSGDEWRISGRVTFYRKGKEVFSKSCRDVETATRFLPAWFLEACDDGKAFFAGEDDTCDQEGCAEKAKWRHELKALYDRRGSKSEPSEGGEYRLFCDRHRVRGDCGLEDADNNYTVTPLPGTKPQ